MNKYHKSRFDYLMDSFNVTGNDLARVLHIDSSLISKWRNNKRPLKTRSSHLKNICAYFIAIDTPNQYKNIRQLLLSSYNEKDLSQPEMLQILLERWLTSDNTNSTKTHAAMLNSNSNNIMYTEQFNVYQGNKGRRAAVMDFLDTVLTSPKCNEMLLVSQEDMDWLVEDTAFLNDWKMKLSQILKKGNKITIIHTVDRNFESLAPILKQWLPLHLTGRISPWYYPKYTDVLFKSTIFLLKDEMALTSLTTENFSKNNNTFLYTDSASIELFQNVYEGLLSKCQPLYEAYGATNVEELTQVIVEAENKHENSYLCTSTPFFTTMPEDLLKEVLIDNNIDSDKMEYLLQYHKRSKQCFERNIAFNFHRHIYELDKLEEAVISNSIAYKEISLLAGYHIKLSSTQFKNHLSHIIKLLKSYPLFNIALVPSPSIAHLENINLWLKENTVTIANTITEMNNLSFSLTASEPTIVNAFFEYYNSIWDSLPRVLRDKERVINKLSYLISLIK